MQALCCVLEFYGNFTALSKYRWPFILEHLKDIAAILRHPCVYSFLHVPVQSGSDSVLSVSHRSYIDEIVDGDILNGILINLNASGNESGVYRGWVQDQDCCRYLNRACARYADCHWYNMWISWLVELLISCAINVYGRITLDFLNHYENMPCSSSKLETLKTPI